jgi:hypothetical protein
MPAYKKDVSRERSRPYTASSGLQVILTGLPPLTPQQVNRAIEYPKKPTYEIPTASGDVETYEHDETTLQSDEDRKAWADYLEAQEEAETELTEKLLYAVLLECVELKDFEDRFTSWKRKQGLLKIPLAEDEEENKFYFMQTEVFHDSDDIGEILTIVMGLTGVSVEDLTSVRDSFPGEVESEPRTGEGNSAGSAEDTGE